MAKFPFLSDDWVAQARKIYAEVQAEGALPSGNELNSVRLNLVVNDAPFSGEPLKAHMDTTGGHIAIDMGHLDKPDVTVSLDYSTARTLFVVGDVQAVMQAFLAGRIRVDGDMTKLLDPRSGIWPAAGSGGFGSRAGLGTGAPLGAPAAQAPVNVGQQRLDVPATRAAEAAARLQEITE